MTRFTDSYGNVIYSSRKDAKPVGAERQQRKAMPRCGRDITGGASNRSLLSRAARALKGPDRAQIHVRNVLSSLRCDLISSQAQEAYRMRLYGSSDSFDELESDIGLCETLAREAERSFDADEFFSRFEGELLYLDAKYGLQF